MSRSICLLDTVVEVELVLRQTMNDYNVVMRIDLTTTDLAVCVACLD